ncbi:hypothetical protein CMO88_03810 [Candidatus Woesearchaeota archaeon]|nr:hypothetical protein [Candidatus Woesearchaeota archaeon]|tara:strand:+ start:26754 stop:27830 length:1077 start_codon:yes stop_codon:yes gene_type:complete
MDELIKLISDLIRFKTTADNPVEIRKCADYIIKYLEDKEMIIKKHVKNEKVSIVVTFKDTKKPDIFLNAHFDVVPASTHLFEPKIENDNLYGRGSSDCKGQVAALMNLMKHFSKYEKKPNIGLMLTSDEEVHSSNGVEYLLSELGYSANLAIVCDAGDDFNIVTKHKGVLQVKISAVGKAVHSSHYWGGINAIEKLIEAYDKIKKLFPKLTKAEWKTTSTLTKIAGGDVLNKVPDYAELYLDIRYTEKDSEEEIMKKLGNVESVQIEKVASALMLETDDNDVYVNKLKISAEKILKRKIKISYEHGATDARFFSEKKIPAFMFKPLGGGAHSDEEYLVISSLEPFHKIMVDFIENASK